MKAKNPVMCEEIIRRIGIYGTLEYASSVVIVMDLTMQTFQLGAPMAASMELSTSQPADASLFANRSKSRDEIYI